MMAWFDRGSGPELCDRVYYSVTFVGESEVGLGLFALRPNEAHESTSDAQGRTRRHPAVPLASLSRERVERADGFVRWDS